MKPCFWISIGCFFFSIVMFAGSTPEEDLTEEGIIYLITGVIFMIIYISLRIKYKKHPELLERKKELKNQKLQDKLKVKEEKNNAIKEKAMQKMICPRCQSKNTNVQIISEQKGTGLFGVLFYLVLAVTIIGIPIMLIILLCKGKKTITHKECVCQDCGKSWRIYG